MKMPIFAAQICYDWLGKLSFAATNRRLRRLWSYNLTDEQIKVKCKLHPHIRNMENIQEALVLLVIGMVTVFVILLCVIGLGKLLIALVNKFAPEEVVKKAAASPVGAIDQRTREVIAAVVGQLTGGKGQVSHIEKV